jgi:mannose-6-phosphate isomerase-like protein (cupin superfamily)
MRKRTVKTGLKEPWLVADFAGMAKIPCPCGASRRAFIRPDNRVCSVHVVEISRDSRTHYHKGFTETYYVLEGEGRLELNDESIPLKPGMAVMIRPGTRHRAVPGASALRILNVVVPPFDPKDEWH